MINKFKYFNFIGILAIFTILISCNKDDDEVPVSPIVGTWNYSAFNFDGTINGQTITSFLMENFDLTQQEAQEMEAFFIAAFVSGDDFQNTTIVFNADGTFETRENGTVENSGTYSLEENNTKLVLTSTDGVEELDVKELTNNRMTLSFTGQEQADITDDGVLENIVYTLEISFVK